MSIRSTLEHENLIPVDHDALTQDRMKELNQEFHVVMVIDLNEASDDDERRTYVQALADAGIIEPDQVEDVFEDENLALIVPFHTLQVAELTYRRIAHATHFVKMWVDGELYTGAC